jgi:hypothetical protein
MQEELRNFLSKAVAVAKDIFNNQFHMPPKEWAQAHWKLQ